MSKIPSLPNIKPELLDQPTIEKLEPVGDLNHPPRILMLYGSLRERSFSRFLTEEAGRIPGAIRRRGEDLRSDGTADGRQRV